jgi:RNA polymerase sigma-70 factor (ECF subfamily)
MNKESNILYQINQKDIFGYEYLFDNYYPSLCGYASRFINQKHLAEDIVQEVFLKLWKSESSFDSLSALKSYLYISVRNASLNINRNNSKLSGIDEAANKDVLTLQIDDKSIEQVLIEEEFYRRIHLAIEKLTPERKRVISLSMEGFSNKEIAAKLGVSINTVKTLKLKAYEALRKELSLLTLLLLIQLTR